MNQKRFQLLRKRADNCIEKLYAIVSNQSDSASIHKTNTHIWKLLNTIMWVEDYDGEYISIFHKKVRDLNYLENEIEKAEKYILNLAKELL